MKKSVLLEICSAIKIPVIVDATTMTNLDEVMEAVGVDQEVDPGNV